VKKKSNKKIVLETFLKQNGFSLDGWLAAFKKEEIISKSLVDEKLDAKVYKRLIDYDVNLDDVVLWVLDDIDLVYIFLKKSGASAVIKRYELEYLVSDLDRKWVKYIKKCGYRPDQKLSKKNFTLRDTNIDNLKGIRKKVLHSEDIYNKFKTGKKKGRL
jgi:hypothetical protein